MCQKLKRKFDQCLSTVMQQNLFKTSENAKILKQLRL